MAVTHKLYGPVLFHIGKQNINLETDTIDVHLMTLDHVFTQDNQYWATISTDEISTGTDYTGATLDGAALDYNTRVTTLTATSETEFCSSGSIAAFHAVIAASSYLISSVDFDGAQESVDGVFKITWTDSKVLTKTVSV